MVNIRDVKQYIGFQPYTKDDSIRVIKHILLINM